MSEDKKLKFLRDLEKLKGAAVKAENYTSPLANDVMKVAGKADIADNVKTVIKNATEKIDTKGLSSVISGDDFAKKISKLRALKGIGKKIMGVLPLAGAGYAALKGDPAMAADELVGDIPVAGQIYEATKSDDAGMSSADEKMMLAEIQAKNNYKNSQASQDKLKKEEPVGRFAKTLGNIARKDMSADKIEALTGKEHPKLAQSREELSRVDDKIAQLEEQGDEESLAFWKKRKAELESK